MKIFWKLLPLRNSWILLNVFRIIQWCMCKYPWPALCRFSCTHTWKFHLGSSHLQVRCLSTSLRFWSKSHESVHHWRKTVQACTLGDLQHCRFRKGEYRRSNKHCSLIPGRAPSEPTYDHTDTRHQPVHLLVSAWWWHLPWFRQSSNHKVDKPGHISTVYFDTSWLKPTGQLSRKCSLQIIPREWKENAPAWPFICCNDVCTKFVTITVWFIDRSLRCNFFKSFIWKFEKFEVKAF